MGDAYTAGEVVWLLGLSREEVELEDQPGSTLGQPDGGGEHGHRIPTLARWAEVRRARDAVIRRRRAAEAVARGMAVLELVARGYTQQEAAAIAGVSQPTVSRRVRASLRDILAELGGELGLEDATSHIELCLSCGLRPRVRVPAVKRHVRGVGMVELRPERPIGLCRSCATAVRVFSVPPAVGAGSAREVLDYVAWAEACVALQGLRFADERLTSIADDLLPGAAAARGQAAAYARLDSPA